MRQEKLKNLEKYGTKLGRSSKTLVADSNSEELAQSVIKKKTEKPKLRPGMPNILVASNKLYSKQHFNNDIHSIHTLIQTEYNPLMGDGSSGVCFRPARRGGAGGG